MYRATPIFKYMSALITTGKLCANIYTSVLCLQWITHWRISFIMPRNWVRHNPKHDKTLKHILCSKICQPRGFLYTLIFDIVAQLVTFAFGFLYITKYTSNLQWYHIFGRYLQRENKSSKTNLKSSINSIQPQYYSLLEWECEEMKQVCRSPVRQILNYVSGAWDH